MILYSGPIGQDIGKALSFPVSSLICFGLNGQSESNESIEVYIKDLIDSYMALMVEAGKSPLTLPSSELTHKELLTYGISQRASLWVTLQKK